MYNQPTTLYTTGFILVPTTGADATIFEGNTFGDCFFFISTAYTAMKTEANKTAKGKITKNHDKPTKFLLHK